MDTLLIPCWNRPEFLWHTLEHLVRTGDLSSVHILFKPDYAFHSEISKVIQHWAPQLPSYGVHPTPRTSYTTGKQSHNLLTGYQLAAEKSDGLVFMVEEDVMVSTDFFRYHREVHRQNPDLFVSLSTRNINRPNLQPTEDSEAYYLSSGDYCSLGTCFKASTLKERVLPHATSAYFKAPVQYCAQTWPGSTLQRSMAEQDGLIRRIQEAQGERMPTAYPHVPRAFHAGYYGYNRRKYVTGNLQTKIARLASIIHDPELMRLNSLSPAHYNDSIPVNLNLPPWKTLKRVQPLGA